MTTDVVPGRLPPQLDEFEAQRLDARGRTRGESTGGSFSIIEPSWDA